MDPEVLALIARATCEAEARPILDAVYGYYINELSEGELIARLRTCFGIHRDRIVRTDGVVAAPKKEEETDVVYAVPS